MAAEAVAATTRLALLFENSGEVREVAGNRPLMLDEADRVWLVTAGPVEIFAVDTRETERGRRSHFFTASAGDLLFGLDASRGSGYRLLAIGAPGTQLLGVRVAAFREWLRDPSLTGELADRLDRWVSGLSSGVTRRMPRPRADLLAEPGATIDLAPGQRVRSRSAVLWARHESGRSLFIGMEDPTEAASSALVPLTPSSWLQTLDQVRLTTTDTRSALHDASLWLGLDAFTEAVFKCELFNLRLSLSDDINRGIDKHARDRRLRSASLADLASVMTPESGDAAALEIDDPLLAAASIVGTRLGLKIVAPPTSADGAEASTDRLGDIVRASRVRVRQVLLKDDWWTMDAGPLLAYRGDERSPVALLPPRPGSYEAVDPVSRARTRVTARTAASFHPVAVSFSRPFPNQALTAFDLFRFATRSVRRSDLVLALGLGIVSGAFGLFTPFLTGLLIDNVIPEAARYQLGQLAIILASVSLSGIIFDTVQRLTMLRVETLMQTTVQPALWDRLLALPVSFFRRFTAGDLSQRVNAAEQMRQVLTGAVVGAFMGGLFSIFLFLQMFYYSWQLALITTAVVALAVIVTAVSASAKIRIQRELVTVEGRIAGLVLQLLTGIAKLRVAGAEGRAFSQWAHEFASKKRLAFRAGRIDKWFAVVSGTIPVVSAIVLYAGLIWFESRAEPGTPRMSPGTFIAFSSASGAFLGRVLSLAGALLSTLMVQPLYERARPILQALPEVDDATLDPGDLSGAIEVTRLTFRYDPAGPAILHDVSLRIEPGEFVAVVGPSGSGKSTLLRMLLGLDRPEAGSVYYDGKDLSMLDVQRLRRRIGVVMQNNKVRAGSLFQNIVGGSGLTLDEAWEAARQAGLEPDISQMPMGMHTVLQQGGMTLSGGQRQRLLIARAIATKPRLLFFDEATSALDNRTQAIVSESLTRLQSTRVVIAHRLSTIAGADRIYVMSAGRIVQSGTYGELSAQAGLFADLIKRQVV